MDILGFFVVVGDLDEGFFDGVLVVG